MLFNALAAATSSVRTWFEMGTFAAWADPALLDVDGLDVPEPPDPDVVLAAVVDVVVVLDPLDELEQAARASAPDSATTPANIDRLTRTITSCPHPFVPTASGAPRRDPGRSCGEQSSRVSWPVTILSACRQIGFIRSQRHRPERRRPEGHRLGITAVSPGIARGTEVRGGPGSRSPA
jgi:hypothetical protein